MAANSATASSHTATAPARNRTRRKYWLFLSINIIVILLIGIASITNPYANLGTSIYVILLLIICTSPALFITTYRGRATLMLMFLAYYFASYALQDFSRLIAYSPIPLRFSNGFFTGGEVVILAGAISFMLGYMLVLGLTSKRDIGILKRDWSPKIVVLMGLIAWAIGFFFNIKIQFGFGDSFSTAKKEMGLFGGFTSLFRVLGLFGTLMLIYSFLTTRKKTVLILLIGTMLADFILGFLGDTKELAVRDPLIFLFSYVIIRERIPVVTTVIFVVLAGLAFNFFAAYRLELATRHETRASAFGQLDSKLNKIAGEDKPLSKRFSEGMDYFADRITLKQNTEIIVAKVGRDMEFKEGYTLVPLLYAFIPRFIMPDKQDSTMTGRIFNRDFHISGSLDTYISIGAVGELYWNFGWTGSIVGMMLIGSILAVVACLGLGDKNSNLPRFLLLLLTVYLLILRSEAGLALVYTYWARTVVLLLLIHALIPKKQLRTTGLPASLKPNHAAPLKILAPKRK